VGILTRPRTKIKLKTQIKLCIIHKKAKKNEKIKNTLGIYYINVSGARVGIIFGVVVCILGGSVYGATDKTGVLGD
jgi:hypothetical protein